MEHRNFMIVPSRPRAVQHAREGDSLADVFQAAHPGDETLDAHAESGVGNRTEAAEIEIPIEGFGWKVVFLQAAQQQVQIVDPLAASDHFAKTLWCYEVDAHCNLRPLRRGLEVERLHR